MEGGGGEEKGMVFLWRVDLVLECSIEVVWFI